ncbi:MULTISPECIES: hypothetical protein [Aurantimonas]|uniref:spike base protein, RCAP_Rcc01079 family n=1 Tax=Aurantimonas TaxID=182269 RepID=UPI0035180EAD|nr:hypothetical protein [Aurantimonas litoralis]
MPIIDNYRSHSMGSSASSGTLFAITAADADLAYVTRGLYVGGAGDLVVRPADGGDDVTFVGVAAGTTLPVRVTQVRAASTATDIVGLA